MIRILALVVALVLPPAAAAAAAAAPATQAVAEARLNSLMAKLADYSAPHQAAMGEAGELVGLAITGMTTAQTLAEERAGQRRVTAEMDAWEAQTRARIESLRTKKDQLPPFPREAFIALTAMAPAFKGRESAYAQVQVESIRSIDAAIAFAERSLGPARKAAMGDPQAMMDLAVETIAGLKLVIMAENAMLDVSIAASPPEHPQTALARSIRASNAAMELFFDYEVASISGDPNDPARAAAGIRGKAEEARRSAREMIPLAAALAADLKKAQPSPTIMRMNRILDSYRESSAVELELADVFERVADLIERGEDSQEALDAAIAPVDVRVNRRLELQAARLELLRS